MSEWERKDGPAEVHLVASGVALPPAIHAATLESSLFASLNPADAVPSWSDVVRDPTAGKLADTVHGALLVYDLPDLVACYQSFKRQQHHTRSKKR